MYYIYIAILLSSLYVLYLSYLYRFTSIETFITRSSRNRNIRYFRELWNKSSEKINISNIYGWLHKTIL